MAKYYNRPKEIENLKRRIKSWEKLGYNIDIKDLDIESKTAREINLLRGEKLKSYGWVDFEKGTTIRDIKQIGDTKVNIKTGEIVGYIPDQANIIIDTFISEFRVSNVHTREYFGDTLISVVENVATNNENKVNLAKRLEDNAMEINNALSTLAYESDQEKVGLSLEKILVIIYGKNLSTEELIKLGDMMETSLDLDVEYI